MIDEITLANMADMLSIASDQTRLKILVCLLGEDFKERSGDEFGSLERNVNEIVALTGASQSLVSHQLKILKDADLVQARRDGRQVFYSLSDIHIQKLIEVVLEHVQER